MAENWIRRIMDDRGIGIEEFAEILDLQPNTVRQYYMGYKMPGKKVKLNIMKILDIEEEEAVD